MFHSAFCMAAVPLGYCSHNHKRNDGTWLKYSVNGQKYTLSICMLVAQNELLRFEVHTLYLHNEWLRMNSWGSKYTLYLHMSGSEWTLEVRSTHSICIWVALEVRSTHCLFAYEWLLRFKVHTVWVALEVWSTHCLFAYEWLRMMDSWGSKLPWPGGSKLPWPGGFFYRKSSLKEMMDVVSCQRRQKGVWRFFPPTILIKEVFKEDS